MRIELDPAACVGHGRCYALAPEVFDADDQGHAVVILGSTNTDTTDTDDTTDLPPDLADKARTAVANCPENALTLLGF